MEKEVNLYSIFRLRLNSIFWGILWGLILIVVCLIFLKFVIEFDIKKNFISKEAVFYIFIFFVAAASEELFARGFILHNLYKSNKHFAILISSSIFALMHIFNSSVNSLALLNLVLAGILLSLLYLKNMNVSLPIGFHLGWNYFQGPVFGFQVSGLPTSSIFKIEHISGSEYFINNFGLEGSIIMTIVFVILNLFLYYRHFCTTKA